MSPDPTPRRAIRIVSQCATKDDFIAVFHPYLERDALFVATASPEEAGARLHFVMTLAGGEAVLRGAGVVVESHRSKSNFYGRRGMKLRFEELDGESRSALRAVEAGPRRHSSAPPPPGRGPNEMVECLIYEDPGTDSREPLGDPGDGNAIEPSDPGNLMPLTVDDDVTAVAPPPRRGDSGDGDGRGDAKPNAPTAVGPAPNGPRGRGPGFQVPRPRSDPSIALKRAAGRVEMGQPDTEPMPELPPADAEPVAEARRPAAARALAEPVPEPPRLPPPEEAGARARRGKGTGPTATVETPPAPAPVPAAAGPGASHPMSDLAALATMRLPAADRRGGPMPPDHFRPDSSPPEYAGGDFTPPPGLPSLVDPLSITGPLPPLVRQPGAPRRPMVPAATITPTEIVSPLALETRTERRRSRSPMASERTDVVRVSYVRTAAVSATLGALLGLGAGYLLWGLEHEAQPATAVTPEDEVTALPDPAAAPTEQPVTAIDAGAAIEAADAAPAKPQPAPAKKPLPRRRRR